MLRKEKNVAGIREKKYRRAVYRSSTDGGTITRLRTINVAIRKTTWMHRVATRGYRCFTSVMLWSRVNQACTFNLKQ